ncbi:hypothetical protein [Amycolatopsis rubida]|uniref:Uncharacterized protein n=1 Tax=Amycolatopsis rubida TaxID=112413 RepID=A0A1I5XDJ8_9PSEU|nr:hypothetical protein [Amycolatopsis rubida]SFQ30055.1 hypothetical protein SAMN05421854_110171 [Amycolatopsis rubida]
MLPPVRITRTELIGCIGRITQRHRITDRSEVADLPIAARSDPREILLYLRKQSIADQPSWASRADALDAQLLVIASGWDRWRAERHHLRGGLGDGLFYDQLGDALGLGPNSHLRGERDPRPERRRRSGRGDPHQPARNRLNALTDLLRYDMPEQDLTRPGRRDAIRDPKHPAWGWLAENHVALTTVARDLAAAATRYKVASRWVDELVADVVDGVLNPGTPAVLGLAVAEIRTSRPVIELTTTHAVHRVLLAADALRCQFSGALARNPDNGKIQAHWQSAPPPTDVAALAAEIARRRERHGDARRDRIPSPDAAEPADLLRFLRSSPAASRVVRAHDHLAGLRLCNALWWQDRAAELHAIRFGLGIGEPRDVLRRQIGSSYAITRGQGVQDRLDRLDQLVSRGKPDEKGARARRGTGPAPLAREEEWVASHQQELRCVAKRLIDSVAKIAIHDDDRYWLDILAAAEKYTPADLASFAFAAEEAETALLAAETVPSVIDDLLAEVDQLPTVRRLRSASRPIQDAE